MLKYFSELIPSELMNCSGAVFMSGRNAFQGRKPVYFLGANPGGDPDKNARTTVACHTHSVLNNWEENCSEYRDLPWGGKPPGTYTIQPKVLYFFNQLGLDPGRVPSSNLFFVRSRTIAKTTSARTYAEKCWGFHKEVIRNLHISMVICFHKSFGKEFLMEKMRGRRLQETASEQNRRGWTAEVYRTEEDKILVFLPHPSRSDWRKPECDFSGLVNKYIPSNF